jgi:hypothetical protein
MDPVWEQDGFVVLQGAAPPDTLAAYEDELPALRERLLVRAPGEEHPSLAVRAPAQGTGAIDPYAISDAARRLLLAEPVVAFLADALGDAPLLVDAAETAAGAPDPGPYRDPTYVAVSDPAALVGACFALEPASVALFPGSHRDLEPEPFSGRHRHFNPERDGEPALQAHRERLAAQLAEQHREPSTVELNAGDVLLWHADLVHEAPRGRALVAHFCPAGAQPGWFAYRPQRARRAPYGPAWITSQHYDLAGAVADEPAERPEPELVADELQRHDAAQDPTPSPPPAAPPRRPGGFASTVRGLMGRRRPGQR